MTGDARYDAGRRQCGGVLALDFQAALRLRLLSRPIVLIANRGYLLVAQRLGQTDGLSLLIVQRLPRNPS